MVVTCHACQTKFRVDDSKIGPRGVKVKCSKCATMIVVKPIEDEATKVGEAPAETMAAARGDMGRFDADPPAPQPQESIQTKPTDLFGLGMPGDLLADDTEQDVPTMVAPPPRPAAPPPLAPPPLRPPSTPPSLETAIGTEKAPGAWQTPPPQAPAASDAGLGDDLFSDPFAQSAPAAAPPPPAVTAADSDQQRFANIEPTSGPSLELDLDTGSAKAPNALDGLPDDPLAGMPKFDENDDAPPSFEGAMSQEGMVTKPVVLANLQGAPRAETKQLEIDERPTKVAPPPPTAQPNKKKPRSNRKAVAVVGYVAIMLLVVAGFFGEYMLFRAGGYEGLLGHRDRLNAPPALGVELGRVTLAPYVSHYGERFMIVRGELHNKTGQASPPFVVDISLDGKKITSVKPGSAVDPVALFERGKIEEKATAETTLAANETRTFTVAFAAPKDLHNLQDAIVFSVAAR